MFKMMDKKIIAILCCFFFFCLTGPMVFCISRKLKRCVTQTTGTYPVNENAFSPNTRNMNDAGSSGLKVEGIIT